MDKQLTENELALLEKIAIKEIVDVETLESRNSDRLDFCEVSVWELKAAMEKAYIAGKENSKLE